MVKTNIAIKPKHQVAYKFILLCLLLIGYFGYLTYRYDVLTGGIASLITWSFFVLCTPVADAGFLLDFPLRLLFGIRMVFSEIVVWAIAILINVFTLLYFEAYYSTTPLTRLTYAIMTTPYPYWAVIFLSGIGTFLSIRFGDELMDVMNHRDREFFHKHNFMHEIVLFIFLILIIFGYYEITSALNMDINSGH
jgi:hypothetical protein